MSVQKTPEEILEFLESEDLSFELIDANQSIETNFFIVKNNLAAGETYLSQTLSFIKYLLSISSTEIIVENIIENLQTDKLVITIPQSLVINTSITQTVNEKIYRIKRIDLYKIEITNETTLDWNVDNLMLQVKQTTEGIVVWPVIITKSSKITLIFTDGILDNYKIFIV